MASTGANGGSRQTTRIYRAGLGVLLTVVTALALAALRTVTVDDITSGTILLVPVVFAAFIGGAGSGLASAAVATVYTVYALLHPIAPNAAAPGLQGLGELLAVAVAAPSLALLVSFQERRRRADRAALEQINASLQAEVARGREVEEALFTSESRFRLVLRQAPIAMFTHDRDLRITWVFSRKPGALEELVGKTDAEILEPEDAERLTALRRGVIDTGAGRREVVEIRHCGERRTFDLTVEPLRAADGAVVGVTTAAVDITEEIARRAALERARADAAQADQAKSRFFAAASHDLRQPFQAMRLFLHLLERRLTQPDQIQLAEKLGEALHSGESLLHALLDVASLEAATVEATTAAFPAQNHLTLIAAEFGPRAAAKGLELRVVPCSVTIVSDPGLLERILRHLVANALRFTARGRVLVGCRRRAGALRLEVWDTGPGIPPDKLSLIFEEFYQLDNAARDRDQGLGLGLAIVQRSARLLGHRIDVRSQPGKGSMFAVEVPAHPPGRPAAPPEVGASSVAPEIAAGPHPDGAVIAVIEDDRLQLMALSTMLHDWGCRAIAAPTATEVLDALRTAGRGPDLVLSDFRLPGGISGPQAIDEIRREFDRDVPGLLVTGEVSNDVEEEAQRYGVGVLHKPLHPERLRAAIKAALAETVE